MGYEPGDDDDGFVKLVVDKSYRILGAHVVGPQADVLVQPFVYLMNAGFTCDIPEKGSGGEAAGILAKTERACPEAGSFLPIYRSMIIHPSLNEVTGWALGNLRPVNIKS
jgi:dihydrolipoamide dehydrogenase